ECKTLYTLRRKTPEVSNIHRAIMEAFASGCSLDWSVHHRHTELIQLPNYPWQREKHWLENERAVQDRINPIVHPILGTQEAPATPVWRNDFDHEPL
ncbi:hypothetical protein MD537_25625, partial [Flavihumibacter sediminis]|nr:hypothetical protein [Flavihumibacter sediminis]